MVDALVVTAFVSEDCVRDEAACDKDDVELWGVEFVREFEVVEVVTGGSDDVVGIDCVVVVVTDTVAEAVEETDRGVLVLDGSEMVEESIGEALLLILSMFSRLAWARATRTSRRQSNDEIRVIESIVATVVGRATGLNFCLTQRSKSGREKLDGECLLRRKRYVSDQELQKEKQSKGKANESTNRREGKVVCRRRSDGEKERVLGKTSVRICMNHSGWCRDETENPEIQAPLFCS
jgi:hypothetical protein